MPTATRLSRKATKHAKANRIACGHRTIAIRALNARDSRPSTTAATTMPSEASARRRTRTSKTSTPIAPSPTSTATTLSTSPEDLNSQLPTTNSQLGSWELGIGNWEFDSMPEGDTILRAARTLQRALAGRALTRFESVFPRLSRIDDDTPIRGRTVDRVEARGKHLLIWLSGDLVLRTHMRMHGSCHIYRPSERQMRADRDMRNVLETSEIHALA